MQEHMVFGEKTIPVNLPDDVVSAPPGLSTTLTAIEDVQGAIQKALKNPLGRPPLYELVAPGSCVTIAFDDPTVPCFAPVWAPPKTDMRWSSTNG